MRVATAIVGLVGVLLGGLLSGFVTLGLEARRERHAARASSRLLEEQLEPVVGALYRLRAGLMSGRGDEIGFATGRLEGYSFTAWERERTLLAGTYPAADWYTVMEAHVGLASLIERIGEGSAEAPEDVQRVEAACRQALGTLGRWGGNVPRGKINLEAPRWGA
jgi:hypothetical protein